MIADGSCPTPNWDCFDVLQAEIRNLHRQQHPLRTPQQKKEAQMHIHPADTHLSGNFHPTLHIPGEISHCPQKRRPNS